MRPVGRNRIKENRAGFNVVPLQGAHHPRSLKGTTDIRLYRIATHISTTAW